MLSRERLMDIAATIIKSTLPPEGFSMRLNEDLGFDSLHMIELVVTLTEVTEMDISDEAVLSLETLEEWHLYLTTGVLGDGAVRGD